VPPRCATTSSCSGRISRRLPTRGCPMPSVQRGSVTREKSGRWTARYYAEAGARKARGGFATKTAAREWLDGRTKEVAALRRGDLPTIRRQNMPTFDELVAEYLAQHNAEANTLRTLSARLRYATERKGRRSTAKPGSAVSESTGCSRTRSGRGGSGYPNGPRGGSIRRFVRCSATRCGRSW